MKLADNYYSAPREYFDHKHIQIDNQRRPTSVYSALAHMDVTPYNRMASNCLPDWDPSDVLCEDLVKLARQTNHCPSSEFPARVFIDAEHKHSVLVYKKCDEATREAAVTKFGLPSEFDAAGHLV